MDGQFPFVLCFSLNPRFLAVLSLMFQPWVVSNMFVIKVWIWIIYRYEESDLHLHITLPNQIWGKWFTSSPYIYGSTLNIFNNIHNNNLNLNEEELFKKEVINCENDGC